MPKIVVCLELIDSEYVAILKDPRPDFHTTGIVPEWQRATAILADSIYGWCLSWPPVTCCLSGDHHPAWRLEGLHADLVFACVRVYL